MVRIKREIEAAAKSRLELGGAWLQLSDALVVISEGVADSKAAQFVMISQMQSGRLRLFVRSIERLVPPDEWGDEHLTSFKAAKRGFAVPGVAGPAGSFMLSRSFLESINDLHLHAERWEWEKGKLLFSFTANGRAGRAAHEEWQANGALVLAAEVEAVLTLIRAGTVGTKPPGGRLHNKSGGHWLAALALRVRDDGFDPRDDLGSLAKLIDEDAAYLGGGKIDPRDARMVLECLQKHWDRDFAELRKS